MHNAYGNGYGNGYGRMVIHYTYTVYIIDVRLNRWEAM